MEPGNEASQDDVSLNDILDDVIAMDDVIMMSLGLYSNVWLGLIIIGTQVVEELTCKFGVESLALTETCSDTNFHVYWYYGY